MVSRLLNFWSTSWEVHEVSINLEADFTWGSAQPQTDLVACGLLRNRTEILQCASPPDVLTSLIALGFAHSLTYVV